MSKTEAKISLLLLHYEISNNLALEEKTRHPNNKINSKSKLTHSAIQAIEGPHTSVNKVSSFSPKKVQPLPLHFPLGNCSLYTPGIAVAIIMTVARPQRNPKRESPIRKNLDVKNNGTILGATRINKKRKIKIEVRINPIITNAMQESKI